MSLSKTCFDELKDGIVNGSLFSKDKEQRDELLRRLDFINECLLNERMCHKPREFREAVIKAIDGDCEKRTREKNIAKQKKIQGRR